MPDELHIIPIGDLIEHSETDDCVCGPQMLLGKRVDDGGDGYLIVHNSLDGRELAEPDRTD